MYGSIPQAYTDQKGVRVIPSKQHKDMWILEPGDGKFWNITASESEIHALHPPRKNDKR